jgi:hypothetical protein
LEQLTVTIKNGKVEMDVEGVKGARCIGLTRAVEQLLGKAVSRVLKKDFYRTAAIKQKITINSLPLHPLKGND